MHFIAFEKENKAELFSELCDNYENVAPKAIGAWGIDMCNKGQTFSSVSNLDCERVLPSRIKAIVPFL